MLKSIGIEMVYAAFENLIIVGDKVLIRPKKDALKTKQGLYLPPGIKEKEIVQYGDVVKVGPGYVMPNIEVEESWKNEPNQAKFIPLQAQVGDVAVFLQNKAYEVLYQDKAYFIVPHYAILMLQREEDRLFL